MSSAIGISEGNGCQVYNLSQSKTLPQFIEEALRNHKSLRKDKDFKERLEVIQGFEFSTSSSKVAISNDGRYIGAAGMYPPDIKIYDTTDLSMKFQRRLDSEVIDFMFLTSDYKKLVLLEEDRVLEFHGQGGRHHRERIPTFGRKLEYNPTQAELMVTSASSHVYRLDLFEGHFLEPFETSMNDTIAAKYNGSHVFVGGHKSACEIFDPRASSFPVNSFEVVTEADITNDELGISVTCIDTHGENLVGCGSSQGVVKLFDIRNLDKPFATKNHNVDTVIQDIKFITMRNEIDEELAVASADSWSVKVWRPTGGRIETMASFESQGKINSICPYPKTGMLFVAQDFPRVGVQFMPAMGLAPKWCPFVDQIVDDLKEMKNMAVFENFEFITKSDLSRLGITLSEIHQQLKPYQHGYMIPKTTYRKLLEEKNLMSAQQLREYQLSQEIEKQEMSDPFSLKHLFAKKDKPVDEHFVNELADLAKTTKVSSKKRKAAQKVLVDDRFASLMH